MLIEVEVQSLGKDPAKHPVVLLREIGGERLLPIWIGHPEASVIALHLADQYLARPLTHDLLLATIDRLGGRLERVAITHMSKSTYYAELRLSVDGEEMRVDARPSDAIALAIRANVPVLAEDGLLDRIQLEIADADTAEDLAGAGTPFDVAAGEATPASEQGGRALTPDELQAYLRALDPEDFGRFNP